MSFGWGAGDILAAAHLLWDLYKGLSEAPGHYQKSAATLRSIQFRLRFLSKVVGGSANPDPLTDTEEASLLETADKDDIRYIVVRLKLAVEKLEALVAEGCDMKLDPSRNRRRRDWPMDQIKKLGWYLKRQDEVDSLIQHIFELTTPLPDLYLKINTEMMRQQGVTQGVYHETQLEYLKAILKKLWLLEKNLAQRQLLDINEREQRTRTPLLYAGPDLGVPPPPTPPPPPPLPVAADTGMEKQSALSHLASIAPEIMTPGIQTRVRNLRADHHVQRKLTEWYCGAISPRLWLYGEQASTVSALIYTTTLDRRRPAIAFTGRHVASGHLLTDQDRLFRLVYSLLAQLLEQFEDISSFIVVGVDHPFTDLGLSMDSMRLALQYVRYFLDMLPECVCLVDGWNSLVQDAGEAVKEILKEFLDLFERLPAADAADNNLKDVRLLLTSRGNSQVLRDLGNEYVNSFDLRNHVGVNTGMRTLRTTLLGIDW